MAATLTAQPVNYSLPGAYQQQQLDAENAYQQALNGIAQQSGSLANQKGFAYDTGDDGSINNVRIDPANQYSEVMGLLGSHAQQFKGLRDQMAGRGISGRVGLAAKRSQLLKFIQGGETSNVGKSFLDQMAALQQQRAGALGTRNTAFNAAESGAAQYALQQQQFAAAQAAQQAQLEAYQQSLAQYQAAQAAGAAGTGGGPPAPDGGGGGGGGDQPQTMDQAAATLSSSYDFGGGQISPSTGQVGQSYSPYTFDTMQALGAPIYSAPSYSSPSGAGAVKSGQSNVNYQARRNAY